MEEPNLKNTDVQASDDDEPSFELSDVQDKLEELKGLGELAHYYYWLGSSHGEIYMAEKIRAELDE
jgi:hypothetical protein